MISVTSIALDNRYFGKERLAEINVEALILAIEAAAACHLSKDGIQGASLHKTALNCVERYVLKNTEVADRSLPYFSQ